MGNILNLSKELYHLFINIFFHNNEFFKKNQLSSCIWFHQTWFPHILLINIITQYIYISASEPKKLFFWFFSKQNDKIKLNGGERGHANFFVMNLIGWIFFLKNIFFFIFMCKYTNIILIKCLFIFTTLSIKYIFIFKIIS